MSKAEEHGRQEHGRDQQSEDMQQEPSRTVCEWRLGRHPGLAFLWRAPTLRSLLAGPWSGSGICAGRAAATRLPAPAASSPTSATTTASSTTTSCSCELTREGGRDRRIVRRCRVRGGDVLYDGRNGIHFG
jgi:hypothetical protein